MTLINSIRGRRRKAASSYNQVEATDSTLSSLADASTIKGSGVARDALGPQPQHRESGGAWLRCLLWMSTFLGFILIAVAILSSWLLITFPTHVTNGANLDLHNPQVVAVIDASWSLLLTVTMLLLQQLSLMALARRVSVSRFSDRLMDHMNFLLRLRMLLGALTMVILLLGIICFFIENATMRLAVLVCGTWAVCCWFFTSGEPALIPPEDILSIQTDEASIVVV